jgi:putative nucleotidyltransferase with HDIG domain
MSRPRDLGARLHPLPLARFRLLARRLASAIAPARDDPADGEWVNAALTPAEYALWERLSPYDRRHAVDVARKTALRLAATPFGCDTRWLGAALMHDIGKAEADLSTLERVVAVLAGKIVGVDTARRWAAAGAGVRWRIGSYLMHGERGAEMIRREGGREEVASWAEIHQGYRDPSESGFPPVVVEALLESDVG